MKDLIGKKVRLIVMLGDISVPFEGILKEVNQWIVLETKGKKKIINKDAVVYAEEKE
jgi:RNase P/RNase MRP subunit p29